MSSFWNPSAFASINATRFDGSGSQDYTDKTQQISEIFTGCLLQSVLANSRLSTSVVIPTELGQSLLCSERSFGIMNTERLNIQTFSLENRPCDRRSILFHKSGLIPQPFHTHVYHDPNSLNKIVDRQLELNVQDFINAFGNESQPAASIGRHTESQGTLRTDAVQAAAREAWPAHDPFTAAPTDFRSALMRPPPPPLPSKPTYSAAVQISAKRSVRADPAPGAGDGLSQARNAAFKTGPSQTYAALLSAGLPQSPPVRLGPVRPKRTGSPIAGRSRSRPALAAAGPAGGRQHAPDFDEPSRSDAISVARLVAVE